MRVIHASNDQTVVNMKETKATFQDWSTSGRPLSFSKAQGMIMDCREGPVRAPWWKWNGLRASLYTIQLKEINMSRVITLTKIADVEFVAVTLSMPPVVQTMTSCWQKHHFINLEEHVSRTEAVSMNYDVGCRAAVGCNADYDLSGMVSKARREHSSFSRKKQILAILTRLNMKPDLIIKSFLFSFLRPIKYLSFLQSEFPVKGMWWTWPVKQGRWLNKQT